MHGRRTFNFSNTFTAIFAVFAPQARWHQKPLKGLFRHRLERFDQCGYRMSINSKRLIGSRRQYSMKG